MKLIIGLGNPGKIYENTRHNVGYMFVDKLLTAKLPKNVIIKKSGAFMNSSGEAVKKLTSAYSLVPSALYIVHDDLDLPLGQYKIQLGVGPKEHKGILSIEQSLDTKDFWRVRIGIDNRNPDSRTLGEDYVLQDFSDQEKQILDQTLEKLLADVVKLLR